MGRKGRRSGSGKYGKKRMSGSGKMGRKARRNGSVTHGKKGEKERK